MTLSRVGLWITVPFACAIIVLLLPFLGIGQVAKCVTMWLIDGLDDWELTLNEKQREREEADGS